jgi:sugar phosphate isomerase/epimerase
MKHILSILILIVVINSCTTTPTNPLDKWAVGTSTRNAGELQTVIDNGLTCIEIGWPGATTQSLEVTEPWAKEMKAAADKAGVEIWSIHIPFGGAYDISKIDEEERQRAVALNAADITMSGRLLLPKVFVIHASAEPISDEDRPKRFEASRKSLKELAAIAKAHNGILAVEVLPRTCLGNTSTDLLRVIDGIDNTAICFDVNHLLQESHSEFIQNTKGKIITTHISDYDFVDERHWLPGRGAIDWSLMLNDLVAVDYPGPFMFEVTRGGNPPISVEELAQCWKKLNEDAFFKK